MYKTVVKLFSKLQNITSMEYYSAIKIIIMKTLKNKEKCFHYDVKRKNAELKHRVWRGTKGLATQRATQDPRLKLGGLGFPNWSVHMPS